MRKSGPEAVTIYIFRIFGQNFGAVSSPSNPMQYNPPTEIGGLGHFVKTVWDPKIAIFLCSQALLRPLEGVSNEKPNEK